MASVPLVPGIADVLARLRDRGHRLGILSSNAAENIAACLRANGVEGWFDFVLGRPRLFGKGRALRKLCRRHRLDPAAVLYVGDEVRDLSAARRAGVASAGVTWGFHNAHLLGRQRPTYLWHSPGDALAALG